MARGTPRHEALRYASERHAHLPRCSAKRRIASTILPMPISRGQQHEHGPSIRMDRALNVSNVRGWRSPSVSRHACRSSSNSSLASSS
eukprot:scaffold40657_cov54-Phaeocystis_antarctica.AAC.4